MRFTANKHYISILIGLLGCGAVSTSEAVSYVYSGQFGSYGSGNGQFIGPNYDLNFVTVDPTNRNILVEDGGNNRVEIFDASGNYLSQFGSTGMGNGQFQGVGGIAVDPSTHDIFVVDGNERIQVFNSAGTYLRQFGSPGTGNGQLEAPVAIAIEPNTHNVVVAELGNERVQIFSSSGTYISQFGGFEYPCYLNIDPDTGNIIVSDEEKNTVQVFSSTGEFLFTFGSYGSGNGEFGPSSPGAPAVDTVTHNILVQDFGNDRVQIFDSNGNYLAQFGSAGNGNGQFDSGNGPTGMDIDHQTGNVVVLDRGNSRAEIFTPGADTDCGPTLVNLSTEPLTASLSQSILFSGQASISQPFGGTMSFVVDGVGITCAATVEDVYGTCVHPLGLGTHSVVARYSGNGFNPAGCSAAASVTVVPDTTQTPAMGALSFNPDPADQGNPVTFNYTVSSNAPNAANATKSLSSSLDGYVTFSNGDTLIAYAPLVDNVASYTTTIAGGSFSITATYSGNSTTAATASTSSLTVSKPSDDIFYSGMEIVH